MASSGSAFSGRRRLSIATLLARPSLAPAMGQFSAVVTLDAFFSGVSSWFVLGSVQNCLASYWTGRGRFRQTGFNFQLRCRAVSRGISHNSLSGPSRC